MSILSKALGGAKAQTNFIGAPSFRHVNPYNLYNHYKADDYASAYPNIRSIVNELVTITPHAIDANGKPVSHPALDALHHPNQKDSYVMFMEKLGTSVLALPYTYLLVWRRDNGEARPGGQYGGRGVNIAGYTFLENPAISYVDGRVYYSIGSQTFTENDVIAIPGGADPRNLYGGYSPTMAAARWSTLDSYIADFQKGFFENNAIPAGVFKVAAPTVQEYDDMVEMLKSRHQGAGNNNNVTYTHVPLDESGNQAPSQIEWIPFAQTNKEIDFKPLLEHVDNRLSEAYGVSNIIKGVDSNATYNNAEVSEAGFAKRAVRPLALRIFSQMTHELNRITGGLGVALTFTYDIPAISDALKVKAETKNIEANMIRLMRADGYSLDTIVDAFGLSPAYKLLREDETTPVINNDKPDVDEGGEVDSSPDPDKIDGVTPINVKKSPRAELTDEDRLEAAAMKLMRQQVDDAVSAVDNIQNIATDRQLDEFVDDAMLILIAIIIASGTEQTEEGLAILTAAGLSTSLVKEFSITDEQTDRYRQYLRSVGSSYSEQTTQSIRSTLERAELEGWTSQEIKNNLNEIPELQGYRAKRIARTETVKASGNGSLYSMEQIASETGFEIYKVWNINDDACEFCRAMRGVRVKVAEPFVGVGSSVVAEDGKILVNDFYDVEAAQLHPNCTCYLTYTLDSV